MKELIVKDYIVLVDDEDFERLSKFKWRVAKKHVHRWWREGHKFRSRSIASEILNKPRTEIDHIDRNYLNNQKSNLRECSCSQNNFNKAKKKGTSSKYKGVSFIKKKQLWRAQVCGKCLGEFKLENDAASAYNKAVIKIAGEFAILNTDEFNNIL